MLAEHRGRRFTEAPAFFFASEARVPTLAVFIDGGYIDAICRQHFDGLRVDYQKLGAEIQRRIGQGSAGPLEHLRTYYYTCPPYQDDPPTAEDRRRLSGYQRFRDAVGYLPRFELREGRLQKTGEAEDGRPIFQQKRVDLLLGLDIALLSAKQQITHMALLAGDGDFHPALKVAKQEGVSFWLLHGPRGSYSRELWHEADERVELDAAFMNAVRRD